ncbi:MAG: S41 family peptidase [Arachidicoccus sp.]|nr:S41 family peptidase [Arachidicoccus sp.]
MQIEYKKSRRNYSFDFRLRIGGSIYLMVDGLASIIGDGKVLSYQYGNGKSENLYLKNGAFFEDSTFASKTDAECNFKKIKIAILISPITASAGEQTVIAFRGKKNIKIFGEKSKGYTILNDENLLGKNLIFVLSSAYVSDRNGNIYKDGITPEVEITGGDNFDNLEKDSKVIAALKWLKEK